MLEIEPNATIITCRSDIPRSFHLTLRILSLLSCTTPSVPNLFWNRTRCSGRLSWQISGPDGSRCSLVGLPVTESETGNRSRPSPWLATRDASASLRDPRDLAPMPDLLLLELLDLENHPSTAIRPTTPCAMNEPISVFLYVTWVHHYNGWSSGHIHCTCETNRCVYFEHFLFLLCVCVYRLARIPPVIHICHSTRKLGQLRRATRVVLQRVSVSA